MRFRSTLKTAAYVLYRQLRNNSMRVGLIRTRGFSSVGKHNHIANFVLEIS